MPNPWLHWWSDAVPLFQQPTFPRLLLALVLGAIIGVERQWRQRAAGMRTNTLVCFGAAAFVDLGNTLSPGTTNIVAYVVSGVGFLGAGAIMKEGGSIRGLNTAATLWCSAAVGACAGAGELLDAVFVTALLVTINIALRPLSRKVDERSMARARQDEGVYRLMIMCSEAHEQEVSSRIMRAMAARPLILQELRTEEVEDSDEVLIQAVVEQAKVDKAVIEQLAAELRLDANISTVEWGRFSRELE